MGVRQKLLPVHQGHGRYNYDPAKIEEYGIYGIVEGDMGGIGPELDGPGARFFDAVINGELENSNPFKKSEFKVDIKEFSRSDESKTLWEVYSLQ